MDNIIDFFRDVCDTFRITPEAEKYIYGHNKIMASLPDCVSMTFSQDWSNNVPTLNPKDTIFPILKHAETSLGPTLAGENTLLQVLNIEQRFTTAEVIIVTTKDNGNIIPVYNRNWLLLSVENKTKHSIITECAIPTISENDDSKLGCYLPDSGTVLLWIDRISETANRNGMSPELLFQKVLLHELIHAVLDCNKRDDTLNVYSPDGNIHGIEETLDNILVLKCYSENSGLPIYNSIKKFISTQPSNYALAAKVFESILSGHLWLQLEGFISVFLSCKISGTMKTKNQCMYYIADIDKYDSEEEEESIREIIDGTLDRIELTHGGGKPYLQSDYEEFQSRCVSLGSGYAIKIDGEWFEASQIDFISEITVRNNIPEKMIKAIIILTNSKKCDFMSMTVTFYNIDKKRYICDLSIINMPKTSDGHYVISSKEDIRCISRLLQTICYYDDCYHWTNCFIDEALL